MSCVGAHVGASAERARSNEQLLLLTISKARKSRQYFIYFVSHNIQFCDFTSVITMQSVELSWTIIKQLLCTHFRFGIRTFFQDFPKCYNQMSEIDTEAPVSLHTFRVNGMKGITPFREATES